MAIYVAARSKKEKKSIDQREKSSHSSQPTTHGENIADKKNEFRKKEEKEIRRQKGFTIDQCVNAIRERTKEEGM